MGQDTKPSFYAQTIDYKENRKSKYNQFYDASCLYWNKQTQIVDITTDKLQLVLAYLFIQFLSFWC